MMPGRKTITTISHICGAAGAVAIMLGGGYAFAQSVTLEEFTVTGKPRHGPPEEFSYRVGYADLDLKTDVGHKELVRRLQIAAAYACKKVDEPDPACRATAVSDAMVKVRATEKKIRVGGATRVAGAPWVPPPK